MSVQCVEYPILDSVQACKGSKSINSHDICVTSWTIFGTNSYQSIETSRAETKGCTIIVSEVITICFNDVLSIPTKKIEINSTKHKYLIGCLKVNYASNEN